LLRWGVCFFEDLSERADFQVLALVLLASAGFVARLT